VENILATPPGTYLKLLEVQIDPAKSAHLNKILAITFSDIDRSWGLHVRNGVAEISEGKPANADATLSMTRENWAKMVAGQSTIEKSLQSGTVNHTPLTGSLPFESALFLDRSTPPSSPNLEVKDFS